MEKNNNAFDGLIALIKKAITEGKTKVIAVQDFYSVYPVKFVYGEMKEGFIEKTFELFNVDKDNICQQLYDSLINEFGEQLVPGYSHGYDGSYCYFMTLGNNVMICFPKGFEYEDWIYNQVQKDNDIYEQEKGKKKG